MKTDTLLTTFLYFLFGALIAVVASIYITPTYSSQALSIITAPSPTPTLTPTPTPVPEPASTPVRLLIPAIGVDTYVEQVGVDEEGRMGVPQNTNNVGWYMFGTKPGNTGSAVIDGHVDTADGLPSVFANLQLLTSQNQITVIDEKGMEHVFLVDSVVSYPANETPLEQIFAYSTSRNLVLITCSGYWDYTQNDYSERTVVYSRLVSSNRL